MPAREGSSGRVDLAGLEEAGKDESNNRFWVFGLDMELPGTDGLARDLSEYTEKDLTGFFEGSAWDACTFAEV